MSRTEPFVIHEQECEFERWDEPATGRVRWRTLLSADRTPTDSLTLGVAELEPGEAKDFRPHRHAQAEVYYILSGEGTVTVSGTEYPVRPGTTVFVPGNAVHGALNTGSDLLRLLYVFPADSFDQIKYEFPDP
jgi:mannose-6-phosphate isomerase-like protein (cupin superfamily)